MTDPIDRRPLASRQSFWAKGITRWLVKRAITPNQISALSMVAGALAGLAFALSLYHPAGLVLGALFCQLRLLCNLFDGLVAVEGGKGEADGPWWNEAPDRVSDLLILGGFGLAAGWPALGLLAAALAIFTAYIRELGRANGVGNDFTGPFAKPQRMALVTVAALVEVALVVIGHGGILLPLALGVLVVGTAATVLRRSLRQIAALKDRVEP